jgi:O-antigen/teichoic acid export membrane protein
VASHPRSIVSDAGRGMTQTFSRLVLSRAADQAALAAASLALARMEGPTAFAPVAVLLVVNSLAIQVSDFGLGFAVMRTGTGERLSPDSRSRLRTFGVGIAVIGTAIGVLLGASTGAMVVAGSWIWLLSGEAYVRKCAALRVGRSGEVAIAEVVGAVLVVGALIAIWALEVGVIWFGLALVLKHLVEICAIRSGSEVFERGAPTATSGAEWFGQVLSYAVANVDYLVVGVVLAPAEFSTYVLGYRFASALPAFIGTPITNTAFVSLAAAEPEDRDGLHRSIIQRAWAVGILGAALVLLLAPILPLLLGSEWAGIGWIVAILTPAVPFRMLLGTAVANAITAGGAREVVRWEAGRLLGVGLAAYVGARWGLFTASAAVATTSIASLVVVHRLSAAFTGGVRPRWEVFAASMAIGLSVALATVASQVSG